MRRRVRGDPWKWLLFPLGVGFLVYLWVCLPSDHLSLSPAVLAASDYSAKIPLGLIDPEVPQDNPMTAAKIELGRQLYFDKRLSVDDTVSCATCHDPKMGFAEDKKVSTGIQGKKGTATHPPPSMRPSMMCSFGMVELRP